MACNVFGTPVTAETLKGMPEYADKESISRKDLAEVAMALKNAEGKDVHSRTYVENMYKRYDGLSCALGLIYNATGAPLEFSKAWDLHCFVAPASYPAFIENGQWGAFLCVTKDKNHDAGCVGAVTYRGYNFDGKEVDFSLIWDTRVLPSLASVLVGIGEPGYLDSRDSEDLKKEVLETGMRYCTVVGKESINGTLFSSAMMGSDRMSVLEVIHRLKPSVPAANE